MKKLLPYFKPYWWIALLTPLTMIGEVVIDLIQPKLMSSIVDDGVLAGNMDYIISTGIKMLIYAIIGGICGVGSAAFSGMTAQNFSCDLRNDVFRRVTALSFQQTDKFTTGSLVTRLTNDITAVQQFADMLLRMFVRSLMLFSGGIVMMLSLDISFGVVLVCALPVEIIIMIWLLKKASPIFSQVQKKLDTVNNIVQENVSGARVVKAYVRENYEDMRFGKANDDLMNTNYLDPRKDNPTIEYPIPENGFILYPGALYLGTTMERTFTEKYVPMISGRSSIGRLGIDIHKTEGFGDIGFDGKWTLEIVATVPVLVYPGMEICQIYFESPEGPTGIKYHGRYQNQEDVERSRFFLDFNE